MNVVWVCDTCGDGNDIDVASRDATSIVNAVYASHDAPSEPCESPALNIMLPVNDLLWLINRRVGNSVHLRSSGTSARCRVWNTLQNLTDDPQEVSCLACQKKMAMDDELAREASA